MLSPTRPLKSLVLVTLSLLLAAAGTVAPAIVPGLQAGLAPATAVGAPQVAWVPNGAVRAVAVDSTWGTQYLGGDFTSMTLAAQGLAVVKPTAASDWHDVDVAFPAVNGSVFATLADGTGGWYVGGDFTELGSPAVEQANLAHVNADGSVDANFTPVFDGAVRALALADGVLYVGGDFASPEPALGAVDAASGSAVGSFGVTTGSVSALAVHANGGYLDATVFAGGAFETGGGTYNTGKFGCVLDTNTCTVDSTWTVGTDGAVQALVLDDTSDTLYVGGPFTAVNSSTDHRHLVRATATTGMLDAAWTPSPDAAVLSLDLAGGTLYAGGSFATVNGSVPRAHLAAFDTADAGGAAAGWDPGADGDVLAVRASDSTVYVAGAFGTAGGETRQRFAALDAGTGVASALALSPDATVSALGVDSAGAVALGGAFTEMASVSRLRAAALDADGRLSDWDPRVSGSVRAIGVLPGNVVLGGNFDWVNSVSSPISDLAVVDTGVGALASFPITVDGDVNAIYVRGTSVYIGGDFANVDGPGGGPRGRLARLSYPFWTVSDWHADLGGGSVRTIADDGHIYVGGTFTYAKEGSVETPRLYAAAFNASTGALEDPWNPAPNGPVNTIAVGAGNGNIYLGGEFSSLAGVSRQSAGAVWGVGNWTGSAASNVKVWNPRPDGPVDALATRGLTDILMGGRFSNVSTYSRAGLGAVTAEGIGGARSWNPLVSQPSSAISAIVYNGSIAIGGTFTSAVQVGPRNFAMLPSYPAEPGPFVFDNTDFGAVPIGTASTLTVQAINRSGYSASVYSIAVSGAGLSQTGNTCAPMTGLQIPNGAMCSITLSWTPGSAGSLSGASVSLTLQRSSADSAPSSTSITGTAGSPGPLTFTGTAFGNVAVGGSGSATVTVTNTGGGPATPSAITPAGSGVTVTGGTCATGNAIAAGGQCTVALAWTPAGTGSLTGASIAIAYSGGTSASDSASLSGTGVQAGPLTFTSGAFGTARVGVSTPLTITVTNTGDSAATPTAITGAGSGVAVTGGTCATGTAITPGATCTVALAWTPSSIGALGSASLTIAYSGGSSGSNSVSLSGTAVQPGPLSFTSGAFGTGQIGVSTPLTITATNTGGAAVVPSAITATGTGVTITGGTCAVSSSIAPGTACTIALSWMPTGAGALTSASLSVAYAGGASASEAVALTGQASGSSRPSGGGGTGGSGGAGSASGPSSQLTTALPVAAPTAAPSTESIPAPTAVITNGTVTTRRVSGPISRVAGPSVITTTPLATTRPAGRTQRTAPVVSSNVGAVVRIEIRGLRPLTRYGIAIQVGGRWHRLGSSMTGAGGTAISPAFTSTSAGGFTVQAFARDAERRYISVRIR